MTEIKHPIIITCPVCHMQYDWVTHSVCPLCLVFSEPDEEPEDNT